MDKLPAQPSKLPEPQKPSIWRSLKFGVITYFTVVSRNYWQSIQTHIIESFRSRKPERHAQAPAKKTEHIKNEVAVVIGDAKDHGKQSLSIALLDPLAIIGAISATYVHFKNGRNNYESTLERREMLAEQRAQAKAQQIERQQAAQEQRAALKQEVKAEVFRELQNHGFIPPTPPLPEAPKPAQAKPLAETGTKGATTFADKYAPRGEEKELTSAGQKGR